VKQAYFAYVNHESVQRINNY